MEPDDKFAAVDTSIFREIKLLSGERIRHERNLRGITQIELAANMGGSPPLILPSVMRKTRRSEIAATSDIAIPR